MGLQKVRIERDEIVSLLRSVRSQVGDRVGIKRFVRLTGISESCIYKHFDSWGDVREEVGMSRFIDKPQRYSNNEILEEFHRVTQLLGRFPRCREFTHHSIMNSQQLNLRFGGMEATVAEYRRWLRNTREFEKELQEEAEEMIMNPQQASADPTLDVKWMRREWLKMRVGFEFRSSDFRGRPATCCDLLVVLEDDWPGCPVRRVVLGQESRV